MSHREEQIERQIVPDGWTGGRKRSAVFGTSAVRSEYLRRDYQQRSGDSVKGCRVYAGRYMQISRRRGLMYLSPYNNTTAAP